MWLRGSRRGSAGRPDAPHGARIRVRAASSQSRAACSFRDRPVARFRATTHGVRESHLSSRENRTSRCVAGMQRTTRESATCAQCERQSTDNTVGSLTVDLHTVHTIFCCRRMAFMSSPDSTACCASSFTILTSGGFGLQMVNVQFCTC